MTFLKGLLHSLFNLGAFYPLIIAVLIFGIMWLIRKRRTQ